MHVSSHIQCIQKSHWKEVGHTDKLYLIYVNINMDVWVLHVWIYWIYTNIKIQCLYIYIYLFIYTLFLFLGENFLHQASDPSSFGVLLLVFIDLLQMLDRLLSLTAQKRPPRTRLVCTMKHLFWVGPSLFPNLIEINTQVQASVFLEPGRKQGFLTLLPTWYEIYINWVYFNIKQTCRSYICLLQSTV